MRAIANIDQWDLADLPEFAANYLNGLDMSDLKLQSLSQQGGRIDPDKTTLKIKKIHQNESVCEVYLEAFFYESLSGCVCSDDDQTMDVPEYQDVLLVIDANRQSVEFDWGDY